MKYIYDHYAWGDWIVVGIVNGLAALFLAGMLWVALSVGKAHGHDWYPSSCCGGDPIIGDCRALKNEEVSLLPSGAYLIDGKYTVNAPFGISPDNHYHACFIKSEAGGVRCFFRPTPST